MKQFAPQQKGKKKGMRSAAAHDRRSTSKAVANSIHVQRTNSNQAVQGMIRPGTIQLEDNRPQPRIIQIMEEVNRKQRDKKTFSNLLSQQKATIPDKQTGERPPANSSYQLTAMSYDLPSKSNVETRPQTQTQTQTQTHIVQRVLTEDLGQLIDDNQDNYAMFLAAIQNDDVTPEERRNALNDQNIIDAIGNIFNRSEALALVGALHQGWFQWRAPGQNRFFLEMYSNVDLGLPNRGLRRLLQVGAQQANMNCWESVLFAAFLLGRLTEEEIYNNWYRGLEQGPLRNEVQLWNWLGYNTTEPVPPNDAAPGKLVFYVPVDNEGRHRQSYPEHVALSIGGGNVVSLWNQPDNINHAQVVDINGFGNGFKIYLGNPPF